MGFQAKCHAFTCIATSLVYPVPPTTMMINVCICVVIKYQEWGLWQQVKTGWPHSSQNEIPCVFPVLHKFSLCYFYAKTNN